jgi:hypothetical protein
MATTNIAYVGQIQSRPEQVHLANAASEAKRLAALYKQAQQKDPAAAKLLSDAMAQLNAAEAAFAVYRGTEAVMNIHLDTQD